MVNNTTFNRTKYCIIVRITHKIRTFKERNGIYLYEFLYSKDNQRIIDENQTIDEPYYGFSKKTSTEIMSRIVNYKGKITDEIAKLISENMGISYSELVWGANRKGMKYFDTVFYNEFWVNVFTDALLSPEYKCKIISIFKDYIPFSKFIIKNNVLYITDKKILEELFSTDEFEKIISDTTNRFLILADMSARSKNTNIWEQYIKYFLFEDNTLKNLSKTIQKFFDYCFENYFQFILDEYGNQYGLEAYRLLDDCVAMTLAEYNMLHYPVKLLEARINQEDQEWTLKKELVIATLNYVDMLASYQKKIEDITLNVERGFK